MSQAGSEREGSIGAEDDLTEVVAELRTEIEHLAGASAAVRRELALVGEVLGGLTLLAEQSDERLTKLVEDQQDTPREQRAAVSEAITSVARTLGSQVQQVESQLVQLATRATALDDIQQSLGRTRDAVASLTTRADRADETRQRLADEQAVALARVTAATDALASTVDAIRSTISTTVETSRDATVEAVDERMRARLDESSAGIEESIAARLDDALVDLGITQLRQTVAEVAEQVVAGRADARAINESIAAFDDRVAKTTGTALLPITTALGRVRQQIEAIPAPDLGPVAAQLARLSAAVTELARDDTASSADIEALRTSLETPLTAFGEQLDAAASGTAAIAESLADALRAEISDQLAAAAAGTADFAGGLAESLRTAFTEYLTEKLTEMDAARQAGMELLARQLTEADAVRRAGTEELSRQLAQQLTRADEQRTAFTEQVTHQLSQADVARHAGVERILTEVSAIREAAERRSASRWRRRTDDDQAGTPARAIPSDHEQRVDQALRDLDQRLTSLAQLVERAGAFADDAAQASIATFRAVTAPPPPGSSSAQAQPAPRKDAASKRPAGKGSTTKKAAAAARTPKATATKRVPTKKASRRDDTSGEPPTA